MTSISSLKNEQQKKVNELITNCNVFFAFSNEQFSEGMKKNPLTDGDKYVSIGAGGYMPKSKVKDFSEGMKAINKWFKSATKDAKTRQQNIAYELANHEAYYTGEIDATLEALGDDYTYDEVKEVFNKERAKHMKN